MGSITFRVIDGVDKGRIFRELPTPVSIGREEGNTLRLNDERVSRFHAKVQQDQGDLVLTDLESTNGTKVNGNLVQIHRLRHGDCVNVGRSVLLFGSDEEIALRQASLQRSASRTGLNTASGTGAAIEPPRPTVMATAMEAAAPSEEDLHFNVTDQVRITAGGLLIGNREFPPLPMNLSPSQSARLAEILDLLHRALSQTTEKIHATGDGAQVSLEYAAWQKILQLQLLLARYHRAVTEPDSWEESSSRGDS
jgi:pSer/pThr/pTyr-binding forkhead associated (FHA) protein